MKIVLILLSIILFTSCRQGSEEPTVFEGKVVFADDGSPYSQGIINIRALADSFLHSVKDYQEAQLGDRGEFSLEFMHNEEIGRFSLVIRTDTGTKTPEKGLDCSPYDCEDFRPGKRYTDLVIQVPR